MLPNEGSSTHVKCYPRGRIVDNFLVGYKHGFTMEMGLYENDVRSVW